MNPFSIWPTTSPATSTEADVTFWMTQRMDFLLSSEK